MSGQERVFGVFLTGEGSLNPLRRTDIHDLHNSLGDTSFVVQVDSTKGGNFGFGIYLVFEDITLEFGMSTIPTFVIGNGEFDNKYAKFQNNTSINTDSLDLFMMFSHFRFGIGYMFNNGGSFFVAPNINYDSETGRMVIKDTIWKRYDSYNHFTYTTMSNGVHIDSLHQDMSRIRGISLGLRTGFLVGRGWDSPLGFTFSIAPYIKYGWRVNTNLYGERTLDPGRLSFHSVFSIGLGYLRKN